MQFTPVARLALGMRAMHLIRRYRVLLAISFVLLLVACGSTTAKHADGVGSTLEKRDRYKKCERLNRDLKLADVAYNDMEHMNVGKSHTIEARVTLRPESLPLPSEDGSLLRVSCTIEAALQADDKVLDIKPPDWRSESFLTRDTAQWQWFVTPKLGGEHKLFLAFRPVIKIPSGTEVPEDTKPTTVPYQITVHVSVPPDQEMAEKFNRITALLNSAGGMVTAFGALVLAIIAVFAIRRRRGKSPPNNAEAP